MWHIFLSTLRVTKSLNLLKFNFGSCIFKKRMSSVFVQKMNVLSGMTEWEVQDENYDFHQEIARSSFADMLHDTDRNQKYYAAIKKAIEYKHSRGEPANVLDIGTGTGLLSMMAAVCKADSIVACEAFPPIAAVAREVIKLNKFSGKIKVVDKRSTDLEVGPGKDLEERANILVTEVFDTELIGEGAIATFNHAKLHLLEEGAIVVPHVARMYGVVVESEWLESHNSLRGKWPVGDHTLLVPHSVLSCPGSPSLHDMQVSQLPPNSFHTLSKPTQFFTFDFEAGGIEKNEHSVRELIASSQGTAHCVIMWWDLTMDHDGEIVVSCAPEWLPDGHQAWRDHWMQAVYYLDSPQHLDEGQAFKLHSYHDEFSLWFNVSTGVSSDCEGCACRCGLHSTWGRSRLAATNSLQAWNRHVTRISSLLEANPGHLLFLGDSSLLPLAVSITSPNLVYCVETSRASFNVLKSIIRHNVLQSKVVCLSSYNPSLIKHQISVVYGEPFFRSCLYPWEGLRFWYLARQLAPNSRLCPSRMSLRAMPMQFSNLHKIRLPLGTVEGFNMKPFDTLIKESSDLCDGNMEVQPLWEYPGQALGPPVQIMSFSLDEELPVKPVQSSGRLNLNREGWCNGVAVWCDWWDGEDLVSSTGPEREPSVGQVPCWDPTSRQGVYILSQPATHQGVLTYSVVFTPDQASFSFSFQYRETSSG